MDDIKALCARFEPVGSRVTCDPAPTTTDEDFLLLVAPERYDELQHVLWRGDWELGGSEIPDECNLIDFDSRFQSYTSGKTNLIVTQSEIFFHRFMAATHVCKRLNLMRKRDRVMLFQAVLYANVMEA